MFTLEVDSGLTLTLVEKNICRKIPKNCLTAKSVLKSVAGMAATCP